MNPYYGRTEPINRFYSWDERRSGALLIVGAPGTGKTNLLRFLLNDYNSTHKIPKIVATDVDKLHAAIEEGHDHRFKTYWIDQNEINVLGDVKRWERLRSEVNAGRIRLVVSTRLAKTKPELLPLSSNSTASPLYNFFSEQIVLEPFSRFEIESGRVSSGVIWNGAGKDASSIVVQVISNLTSKKLIEKMRLHPELLRALPPRVFEELVAELLNNIGYNAELTKQTRDGGYDIIATRRDILGEFQYLVECKRYSQSNRVGVDVPRQLLGTVMSTRSNGGIIVTTSSFTDPAWTFQKEVQSLLQFAEFDDLKNWLNNAE